MEEYDVVVVGLGAMGAHAAEALAARGVRVLGIERFGPLHDRGSSHGDSRIIRLAYFEDPAYVPLLHRAYERWRALEARAGEELLTITGILQVGPPHGSLVEGVLRAARQYDIPQELLTAAESRRRFEAFKLSDDEVAVFEPQGGHLRPERCVASALKLADHDGAVLRFNERVVGFDHVAGGIEVATDRGRYRAGKVIVAAGSYVAGLLPQLAPYATPIKQVVGWFPAQRNADLLRELPVFIVDEGQGMNYFGFPDLGRGVKLGKHAHLMTPIDPEAPNPPVTAADREALGEFMRRRLPDTTRKGDAFVTCRYTMLPDDVFLIDTLPDDPDIIVASPCSGHGFKFASVVGEILADLATIEHSPLPIDLFSFAAMQARAAL